jgi:hypothetical protein
MQNVRSELLAGAALGAAMLIGFGLSAPRAQAGYIVTLDQVGSNVVATGSGALDLTGQIHSGTLTGLGGNVNPNLSVIEVGSPASIDLYGANITGPAKFGGTGGQILASSNSGDDVAIQIISQFSANVAVPKGYVFGNSLTDTSTWDNATFASLGVIPGTYEWKWGSGANQNFTLDIQAAPAPVIGHGLLVFLAVGGVLFGSKLLEWRREARLQSG